MVFDELSEHEQRIVADALADGWLSGWRWSQQDVRRLAALATRSITFEDYRAEVLTSVDRVRDA